MADLARRSFARETPAAFPQQKITGRWLGQDGHDFVGPNSSLAPSGVQDMHIRLTGLPARSRVTRAIVKGHGGDEWQYGGPHGPWKAHFVHVNGSTTADLFLEPSRLETGRSFELILTFEGGRTAQLYLEGGKADPALRMAAAKLEAKWIGQEGADLCGDGPSVGPDGLVDVLIQLRNLAANLDVRSLTIRAGEEATWEYGVNPSGHANAALRKASNAKDSAALYFQPDKNRAGQQLQLLIEYANGTKDSTRLTAGPADPKKRTSTPELPLASSIPARGASRSPVQPPKPERNDSAAITAKPGDDLQSLVSRGGTIHLAPGTHRLNRPLVFPNRPTTLAGTDPRDRPVLVFSQEANAPPWTAALKIHSGSTALSCLAIRFAGPVRWDRDVSYGPAVIGTTDNRDQAHNDPTAGLVFRQLDLEGPPPATRWEEAPRLMRLVTASSGEIDSNRLRGGAIEVMGGPWKITRNSYLGTQPGTYTYSVISAHRTRELLVADNEAGPFPADSGKTWRFLVMTHGGFKDVIRNNTIAGIGPRDDDPVKENAPEIILTESYRLRFEGRPRAISKDGRILAIGEPPGGPAEPGEVVAILDGPHAGTWRRISRRIDEMTYQVDPPLPTGGDPPTVSISDNGFVEATFEQNTIDGRGSTQAVGFLLAGHHYGTRIINNTVKGCGEAFRIVASPTETPVHWGWSHAPIFGLMFQGNRIEAAAMGVTLAVEHGPPVKTSRGRVYFTGEARDNVITSGSGVESRANKSKRSARLVIGDGRALDPAELRLTSAGNTNESNPKEAIIVEAGQVNGVVAHRTLMEDKASTDANR